MINVGVETWLVCKFEESVPTLGENELFESIQNFICPAAKWTIHILPVDFLSDFSWALFANLVLQEWVISSFFDTIGIAARVEEGF